MIGIPGRTGQAFPIDPTIIEKQKGSSGRGDGGRGGRLEQGGAGWCWAEGEEKCIQIVDLSNVET
jgi:hypothetical protein